MNKIFLIIRREYLTRVRKRSFIIMTILGPVLMASMMIVPIYLATLNEGLSKIAVVSDDPVLYQFLEFKNTSKVQFSISDKSPEELKATFDRLGFDAMLYIPKPSNNQPPSFAFLYSRSKASLLMKTEVTQQFQKAAEKLRLHFYNINEDEFNKIKAGVKINSIKIDETGMEVPENQELKLIISMFLGIMIYFVIFMFGSQVMRGIIEEKTNRIVEVIVSSVKPFQLMMGKIIGVAFVGLTQFLLWILLTAGIVGVFQLGFSSKLKTYERSQMAITNTNSVFPTASEELKADNTANAVGEVFNAIHSINFTAIILTFLFYFLLGYLMYGALFAAVGGAVDNEADTQQFMLPLTIPLILCIVVAQFIANNPNGPVAFWFSIIPLTSPIAMMLRIPYGVPYWELALSMVLLILAFLGSTWIAGKIYRTGILMYGKKITYRELWKWLKY